MSGETTVRVGVLSLHNSKETKAILNAVEALGHDPVWLRRENTSVEIRDGELVLEPDVDVIANRLLLSKTEYPDELLGLVNMFASIVPTLNRPMSVLRATHKFAAAVRLAEEGIRVPDAILALSTERLNELCEPYGSEAVYKTAIGTHGGGTWKVDLNAPISSRVGKRQAFVQQLIEQGANGPHSDLRVYVVGDSVIGGMIRSAPEEEWRTNVALGGDVSAAGDVLTDEVTRIALDAADAIGLDYAGVDLIRNEEDWYVLEVNPTAGFKGFFEATGHSPAPHIARAAIETAGGSVDEDRVMDLTATLDDTVPSCKPSSPAATYRSNRPSDTRRKSSSAGRRGRRRWSPNPTPARVGPASTPVSPPTSVRGRFGEPRGSARGVRSRVVRVRWSISSSASPETTTPSRRTSRTGATWKTRSSSAATSSNTTKWTSASGSARRTPPSRSDRRRTCDYRRT